MMETAITSSRHSIELKVNGIPYHLEVEARRLLVDVLRQDLGLTGTHVGCEQGICGGCTVLLNGHAVNSCLTFAVQADGATIVCDGVVAGYVVSFERDGQPEVSYWIGKEHWGKGIATRSLAIFLREQPLRPLQARVATDNAASIRVLEKCGFTVIGEDRYFANARGEEIDELILELRA